MHGSSSESLHVNKLTRAIQKCPYYIETGVAKHSNVHVVWFYWQARHPWVTSSGQPMKLRV